MRNALHKTYLVSFPRSGQHMVARGLMWILPDLVVYSENYQVAHTFDTNAAVNIQKSHDFNLDLPFTPDYRYIVLIRDFESAIKSWWRLHIGNGGEEDTEENFRRFMVGKREYYDGFMETWLPRVKYNKHKNIELYEFRQLRSDPIYCMHHIVKFVVRDIPKALSFENNRQEAYTSFSTACKQWILDSPKPFPYTI